ncbi:cyclic nucleotide-binding domain-containing protein [Ramlibacter sp. USB13]|uniref:Cyclic nucleotide-binding domain-containing protein n=1 Tax=Ramlibacter cellulosilyticus TaxID=2764187 RepID=A0A923SCU3_9BURK|nr:cyclic nucleotide-binding domain-containing protein [Ramlibacter cellulosilyticus]
MPPFPDPRENCLLAALGDAEWRRVQPHLQPVSLALGQVLYSPGGALAHIVFPATAIVSLLQVMENGASAEVALVGNEGLVGFSLFMGGQSTSGEATGPRSSGARANAMAW